MPNSKHRKKQLATNRKQLERIRKKIQYQNSFEKQIKLKQLLEDEKENIQQGKTPLCSPESKVNFRKTLCSPKSKVNSGNEMCFPESTEKVNSPKSKVSSKRLRFPESKVNSTEKVHSPKSKVSTKRVRSPESKVNSTEKVHSPKSKVSTKRVRSPKSKVNSRKKVHLEIQKTPEERLGWLAGLYDWCQSGITQAVTQGVEVAAMYSVFPSHNSLRRQLEEANVKLREMEQELSSLRGKGLEEGKKKINKSSEVALKEGQALVPPPPPPPPPPLPVTHTPIRKVVTRSRSSKLAKLGDKLPAITLDDIKKVKLKSSRGSHPKGSAKRESSTEGGTFVMSIADLRAVKLQKTRIGSPSGRKSSHCSTVVEHSHEFCRMKHLLKKVNHITRTRPDEEFGEGTTPMLIRALRKKFLVACPMSPIQSFSPSPLASPANTSLKLHTSQTSPFTQPFP